MPFAGFENWDDCTGKMLEKGHSEESANKICGYLKNKIEGFTEKLSQDGWTDKEKEEINKCCEEKKYKEVTVEEMAKICPTCADKMKEKNIARVKLPIDKFQWETLPEGWTEESLQSFWANLGGSATKCIEKMGGIMDNPEGFCASLKDKIEGTTEWRGHSSEEIKIYESLEDVEIFAVGVWKKDKYTKTDIESIVKNFEELKDVVKPPAKLGHSEGQNLLKKEGLPAAGWVDNLKVVGDKLVATFKDVPKKIKELIEKRAYKRVSAEIYPVYKDSRNGKVYNNVLRAVAFLGGDIPAVETLTDILSLYTEDNIEYKVYEHNIGNEKGGGVAMGNWTVTVDGASKEVVVEKLSQMFGTDAKLEILETKIYDEKVKKFEDGIEELKKKIEILEKAVVDKDAEIEKLKGTIKGKDEDVEKMSKEIADIKKLEKTEKITSFVQKGISEGKILPKEEESIVALMEQLDDKVVVKYSKDGKDVEEGLTEILKKFISDRPKVVEFKELSPQVEHRIYDSVVTVKGTEYKVENIELMQKAEKYAEDNKVDFGVALLEVSRQTKE